jgi:NAD(P)-dependent dehydrogenase (short-subunit alcohol dehydrogenase family)
MAKVVKSQPLGRFGSVRDIADATVYLFADTGSYVSGQILVGRFLSSYHHLSSKLTKSSGRR